MKKFLPILTIFSIISIIVIVFLSLSNAQRMVVVQEGNIEQKPLDLSQNHYQDSDCGMIINNKKYASQVIDKNGKTWFFHDHGGMVNWLSKTKIKDDAVIWVWGIDTNSWIDGRKAWYSRNEKTPMNNGFGAYKENKDGLVSFEEMTLLMLRGETMNNPYIKEKLLGNN